MKFFKYFILLAILCAYNDSMGVYLKNVASYEEYLSHFLKMKNLAINEDLKEQIIKEMKDLYGENINKLRLEIDENGDFWMVDPNFYQKKKWIYNFKKDLNKAYYKGVKDTVFIGGGGLTVTYLACKYQKQIEQAGWLLVNKYRAIHVQFYNSLIL